MKFRFTWTPIHRTSLIEFAYLNASSYYITLRELKFKLLLYELCSAMSSTNDSASYKF